MFRSTVFAAALCCISLAACGPDGAPASAGSTPAPYAQAATAAAAVADAAALPPPSSISPTAKTTIDDAAIAVAFDGLDTAATAADLLVAARPSFIGTPAALSLANALEGASTWLKIASQAQRASQAENYTAALAQASAALAGARTALAELKAK